MAQDDPGLQELVTDFVTESREHLGHVESDLLSLESKGEASAETVNRVFRAVHSVKGVAGFLGFDHINRLAHALESVLDLVRKDRLEMSGPLADALLASTDRLRELIENVNDSNTLSIDEALVRLQGYLEPPTAKPAAGPPVREIHLAPDEWLLELSVVVPTLAAGLGILSDGVADAIGRLGRVEHGAADLCARLGAEADRQPVLVSLATTLLPEAVRASLRLEEPEVRVVRRPLQAAATNAPTASPGVDTAAPVAPLAHAPVVPKTEPESLSGQAAAAHESRVPPPDKGRAETPARRSEATAPDAQHESIRVAVPLLDRLMNLSGELVLGRNQLLQARSVGNEKGLTDAASRLNQVVSEMQEAIMQTRMQPIGSLFSRFPRVVRDLSGKLGERCRLDIQGKDVDLDRSILEALSDPLTHLVRNAVDHGMETTDQRRTAGKEPEGVVCLTAAQQGGNVRIEISDDGRGIDANRLKGKAVEKGVITAESARTMSEREAVHLIFAPGFSTAEKVTDVSGRGVGMDVVRSNIERLGGHVDVVTVLGRGTTIAITIPLTLAILPAMVVTCGPRRYVLAQANVAELVRARGGEGSARIVEMDGREVLRLRGSVLPLLRLRKVLGEAAASAADDSTIIVVETANLRYGLVVDAPPDAEEIVVKPLSRHLKKRGEYAGATILGDGRVAMILDAAGIAEAAALQPIERAAEALVPNAADAGQDLADLVLFRNHPGETFAVPLGLVDRIQRVAAGDLVEIGGCTVFAEGERALPIVHLERVVRAQPGQPSPRVSVLVLRLDRQQFGLVAPQIEDIRSLAVHIDERTLAEAGVLGSFQLQERTVRLLDPSAVAKKALPQLFVDAAPPAATTPAAAARGPLRVLFAEDTKFFREHVTRTLRNAGFEVVAAADGELAWQELGKAGPRFDIVVTDVQMPNCDGLELTRRIRRSEAHGKLPVVALTSLSSAEDTAAGTEAGVTAYLVKLDDAALVAAVREHGGVIA